MPWIRSRFPPTRPEMADLADLHPAPEPVVKATLATSNTLR